MVFLCLTILFFFFLGKKKKRNVKNKYFPFTLFLSLHQNVTMPPYSFLSQQPTWLCSEANKLDRTLISLMPIFDILCHNMVHLSSPRAENSLPLVGQKR